MTSESPCLLVVAGPNGSGKSTLTRALLDGYPIVDPDRIFRELVGKPSELQAGRQAVRLVRQHIAARRSFVIETTLSGNWVIAAMRRAKLYGFLVELHFIGLDQVETAILRVRDRVLKGGHDIALAAQLRRFPRSFQNLIVAAKIADETRLYDNSTRDGFRELAFMTPHVLPTAKADWPNWAKAAVRKLRG